MSDDFLRSLYFDPKSPASFLGLDKFYDEIVKHDNKYNLSKNDVKRWLESQDVYTMYRPVKRKFRRNKIVLNDVTTTSNDTPYLSNISKISLGVTLFVLVIIIIITFVALCLKPNRRTSITPDMELTTFENPSYGMVCIVYYLASH